MVLRIQTGSLSLALAAKRGKTRCAPKGKGNRHHAFRLPVLGAPDARTRWTGREARPAPTAATGAKTGTRPQPSMKSLTLSTGLAPAGHPTRSLRPSRVVAWGPRPNWPAAQDSQRGNRADFDLCGHAGRLALWATSRLAPALFCRAATPRRGAISDGISSPPGAGSQSASENGASVAGRLIPKPKQVS
jgi:hypothetical protein